MRIISMALILLLGACSGGESPEKESHPNSSTAIMNVIAPVSSAASSAPPAIELHTISPASAPVSSKSGQNTYHVGVSSLGMSFNEFLSHFDYDATDEDGEYYWVSKNGDTLFGLNDKNWLQNKVVWMIVIRSPNIKSDGGIHVGMSVEELLKKYPGITLSSDEDDQNFYAPPELEKGTPENPDAAIFFYVSEGAVSSILIFVTGSRPLRAK